MAIRKSIEETLVVDGARAHWLDRSFTALEHSGFSKIEVVNELHQLHAMYRKLTIWGSLDITLIPEGEISTRIHLRAVGNVDNIYALFRSPSMQILKAFKSELLADEEEALRP